MSRHASWGPTVQAEQRADLRKLQAAIQSVDWNIPCSNDNRWISDADADQALAAEMCAQCPVIIACRNYINRYPLEQGVYAGTTYQERNAR